MYAAASVATAYQRLFAVNDNTPQGDINQQVLYLLGQMRAELSGIREDIIELSKDAVSDRQDNMTNYDHMLEKVDSIDRRTTKLESTVRVTGQVVNKQTKRLDIMQPIVEANTETIKRWVLMAGSVVGAVSLAFGGVWYALKDSWWAIYQWIINALPK